MSPARHLAQILARAGVTGEQARSVVEQFQWECAVLEAARDWEAADRAWAHWKGVSSVGGGMDARNRDLARLTHAENRLAAAVRGLPREDGP